MKIKISDDLDEVNRCWADLWPREDIFGCWEVRKSFQDIYNRPLHALIAESGNRPVGILPLSWIEEERYYAFFPGETFEGETWLEQNHILADNPETSSLLLEAAPWNTDLRYLVKAISRGEEEPIIDEIGYLFNAPDYGYDFERYWNQFSGKSRKKLRRDMEALGNTICSESENWMRDIDWMLRMNRSKFGRKSYFSDSRFMAGFEGMLSFLKDSGMLRVTRATAGGSLAAVDIGAVRNGCYTVMAGATSPEFPGIAKVINLHHIKISCTQKYYCTDFLCGDFGWKERFHLRSRPLYRTGCITEMRAEREASLVGA